MSGCTRHSRCFGRNLLNSNAACHDTMRPDAAATAYTFCTRSVRAFAFWTQCVSSIHRMSWRMHPDDACYGTTQPDAAVKVTAFRRTCYGICRLDEECQGICILDVARVFHTENVMANSIQMTPVTAPHVRTQLSRRLPSDAAAMVYAIWMRSVRAFAFWTQRMSSIHRMSWQIASGQCLSWNHTSKHSCHGTENRTKPYITSVF